MQKGSNMILNRTVTLTIEGDGVDLTRVDSIVQLRRVSSRTGAGTKVAA